jgi:hypothetical protein
MPNLGRRVAALEKWFPPEMSFPSKRDPHIDDEIMGLAQERLSEEDRELCALMGQRADLNAEWTDREEKALAAFGSAITLECQRAGYRSFDEFHASYCGGQSRTRNRYR